MKRVKILLVVSLMGFVAIAILALDFSSGKGEGCPFCSEKIFEIQGVHRGEYASVILPYKPISPGHALIVPNRHVERYERLSLEEISEMGALAKKVEAAVRAVHHSDEYILLQKNGARVGQSVPHVHLHLIPKPEGMGQLAYIMNIFLRPILKPVSVEELVGSSEELAKALEQEL